MSHQQSKPLNNRAAMVEVQEALRNGVSQNDSWGRATGADTVESMGSSGRSLAKGKKTKRTAVRELSQPSEMK